jgi:hypothetical protein
MESADIFAYGLNTVIVAGPAVVLAIFALATAWMNHVPSRVRALDLAPSFGLCLVGWVELIRAFTPVFAGYAKPIEHR